MRRTGGRLSREDQRQLGGILQRICDDAIRQVPDRFAKRQQLDGADKRPRRKLWWALRPGQRPLGEQDPSEEDAVSDRVVGASGLDNTGSGIRTDGWRPSIRDAMLAAFNLRAFAISLCGNVDRADDLVQEGLLSPRNGKHQLVRAGHKHIGRLFTIHEKSVSIGIPQAAARLRTPIPGATLRR